jgi:hypothetical protein
VSNPDFVCGKMTANNG